MIYYIITELISIIIVSKYNRSIISVSIHILPILDYKPSRITQHILCINLRIKMTTAKCTQFGKQIFTG